MHLVNPFIFQTLPEPNTFIGGVGASYVTTVASLVSKLVGVTEPDIKNFQNVSNNVSFYTGIPFRTTLFSSSQLTYYIDKDGLDILFNGTMYNSANLKYLYAPNAAASSQALYSLSGLLKINFNPTSLTGRNKLNNASSLKKLSMPNATTHSDGNTSYAINHQNLTSLERLDIRGLTTIGSGSIIQSQLGNIFSNIKSGCKVFHNSALGVQNRKPFTSIRFNSLETNVGDKFYIDGRVYTAVAGSPVLAGDFEQSASGQTTSDNFLASLTADARSGASDFNYTQNLNNIVIEAKLTGVAWEKATTIDGANTGITNFKNPTLIGGYDVAPILLNMRDLYGCVLIQCSTPITVNPPTALSASSITSSGFTINFTAPTANANGTELFEVWVAEKNNPANPINYFYYDTITATGTAITGLESGKTYIVKMNTQDGQMNFSAFSSTIEVTTS